MFGTFNSGDFVIAAHAFIPQAPRGTVLLLHGISAHAGTLANTMQHLVEQDYAVATFDLPGHGLSSGGHSHQRFRCVQTRARQFIALIDGDLPRPYHAVAHSTGAAILVCRYCRSPTRIILEISCWLRRWCDPHSGIYQRSALTSSITWSRACPGSFEDSSDPAFLEAVRSDPMQPRQTSLAWVEALVNWNQRIATYPPSMKPVFIIQGKEDDVVDWDYNLAFLRDKFPNATIETIEEGKHNCWAKGLRCGGRCLPSSTELWHSSSDDTMSHGVYSDSIPSSHPTIASPVQSS